LVWVVHRLLLDRFSWPILLADLQTAYEQVSRGETVQLPPKTTSFKYWAERLQENARPPERQELPLWADEPPVAFSMSLSADRTRELLEDVPRAYGTRTSEVLLAALGQAFQRCTDARSMLVEIEAHTRDSLFDDVDLSRTVGCFTTIWPLQLKLDGIEQPGEALKLAKEQVRDDAARGPLRPDPSATVGFTFLGDVGGLVPEAGLFVVAEAQERPAVTSIDPGRYPLQLVACIDRGRLRVDWTYRAESWNPAAVGRLAHEFVEALEELIVHCQSEDVGGYTPSDFPQADISQADLDKFLSAFGQAGT
jgi:non-ribosomal peptide synthase protein (TIGR01720 family)